MNGVNRMGPTRERIKQIHALRAAVEYKLEVEGWNPITGKTEVEAGVAVGTPVIMASVNELTKMTFVQAIDFAFDQKKVDLAKKKQGVLRDCYKIF